MMYKKIKVNLKDNAHSILIGDSILKNISDYIEEYSIYKNILVVIDEKVFSYYKKQLNKFFKNKYSKLNFYPLRVNESIKSISYLIKIHSFLLEKNYGRDTTIIAIGGGVIGDLAGFAASTYMRGVHLIQVPTTLLSAVDSSVGGKTGINFKGRKNILGSFYQPKLVIVDIEFLFSLPKQELTSGLGEIIKYSYLWKDDFFNFLNNNYSEIYNFNKVVLQKLIYNSLLIKSKIVVKDEKEGSLRKILNLGHTFAHAFESNLNFRVKHGQAVIAGLVASFYLSNQLGILRNEDLKKYISLPSAIKIGPFLKSIDNKTILKIMGSDKKNRNGQIRFVLLKKIGEILLDVNAKSSQIYSAINKTKKLFN